MSRQMVRGSSCGTKHILLLVITILIKFLLLLLVRHLLLLAPVEAHLDRTRSSDMAQLRRPFLKSQRCG